MVIFLLARAEEADGEGAGSRRGFEIDFLVRARMFTDFFGHEILLLSPLQYYHPLKPKARYGLFQQSYGSRSKFNLKTSEKSSCGF